MAKAATATKKGPALRGGTAGFNADRSWSPVVCDAIRLIKEDSDKVTVKLTNAEKTRNAVKKQLVGMAENDPEYAGLCKKFVKQIRIIDESREERDAFVAAYANMVTIADSGEIDPDAEAKDLVKLAIDMEDEEDEEDEEDDNHQLKLGGKEAGPSAPWMEQLEAMPEVFGRREAGIVKPQFDKLHEKCTSPLAMARWLAAGFGEIKETKNRREMLPTSPAWFAQAIRTVLARQVAGEVSKGVAADEGDAAQMLVAFKRCAHVDVDAWVDISGGKDSELNKLVLGSEKASV